MTNLTAADRSAIARKAAQTRRMNIAKANLEKIGGHFIGQDKPASLDTQLIVAEAVAKAKAGANADDAPTGVILSLKSLAPGTLVRFYDEGWRYARLIEAGAENTELETIPAYRKSAHRITVATRDVRPAETL